MIMKSIFLHILFSIALISSLSAGSDAQRRVTLAYGQSKDDIDIYRIGLKREFQSKWFDSDFGNLGGYYEWSANYWKARNGECNVGASFSPVFVYELNSAYSYIPYLEAGIGISLFSKTSIEKRELPWVQWLIASFIGGAENGTDSGPKTITVPLNSTATGG
jgi:lipid A 3-O-deacylase